MRDWNRPPTSWADRRRTESFFPAERANPSVKRFVESLRDALRAAATGGEAGDGEEPAGPDAYECPNCGAMILHPDGDTCSQCHTGHLQRKT